MDACPTHALSNGSLDARKCISYLTIESKSNIPSDLQPQLSGNALGCDICADACPWNTKWATPHQHKELATFSMIENDSVRNTKTMLEWDFERWIQLTEEEFNSTFMQSAIRRAGYAKLRKNIEGLANNR
jgi:epoxyqueuosine reductase